MKAYYFLFCQDELLLTADNSVPLTNEVPVRLEAWQQLHHLPDLDGYACYTAKLDAPITDAGWKWRKKKMRRRKKAQKMRKQ